MYTGDEWHAKGEQVLAGAHAVIAFENQLVSILNYSGPWAIEDELQSLAKEFGYYFEMGNHWNIGFYPLDTLETLPSHTAPYLQLLNHPRWKAKRQRILARAGEHCEECGRSVCAFEIHHCYYRYGRLPWQYPDGSLLALCGDCHKRRGKAEIRFRMFMTGLKVGMLEEIRRGTHRCAREAEANACDVLHRDVPQGNRQ
jgi:hypothetical protein